tara:strand:- start:563 stop:1042 length:480 start_codon:yes stop_codon:yes gene_type:complete
MDFKKLFNKDDLIKHLNILKKNDLIIGFTNGCFDLLHKGHLSLLSKSKSKCDYLIVGLNSDISVAMLKGENRPIENELIRLNKLSNIKDVDALVVFADETPFKIINELLPNILFKGADYKNKKVIGSECVIKNGGKIEFIDILDGFSTTNIIKNSSNKS